MEDTFNRWVSIMRMKASDYEHKARKEGEIVTSPSLDDICNEMATFLAGAKVSKG